MQVESRYKWVFILAFITFLIIAMAYMVSEKLIRHLDEKRLPIGGEIHLKSINEFEVWVELSLDIEKHITSKII